MIVHLRINRLAFLGPVPGMYTCVLVHGHQQQYFLECWCGAALVIVFTHVVVA